MGHAIPKIEWKNETQSAVTTSGSDTLTAIFSTDAIEIGMLAEGVGIPANSLVLAKTADTVQLSNQATASATNDIEFLYRISFDYPPIEEAGEEYDSKDHSSTSISGQTQTSIDYVEGIRTFTFSHLSSAIFLQLQNFHITHGYISGSFRYYDDKTLTTFLDYELNDLKFKPKKIAPRGTDYVWLVPYVFRRVVI